MTLTEVRCPKYGKAIVIEHARTAVGKQRYLCKDCNGNSFILEYT